MNWKAFHTRASSRGQGGHSLCAELREAGAEEAVIASSGGARSLGNSSNAELWFVISSNKPPGPGAADRFAGLKCSPISGGAVSLNI